MRISFFTKPLASLERFAKDCERRFNYLKYKLRGNEYKAWTCSHTLGGHQDIVDSFIKGAKYFPDVELLVNPSREEARGSVAYVPCSWRVLRDVIEMKRNGVITRLIAGPLICYRHVNEHNFIIFDESIDCYLLASDWVVQDYWKEAAQHHRTFHNLRTWAAGIDAAEWSPSDMKDDNPMQKVLIYVKRDGWDVYERVQHMMELSGREVKILKYGEYVPSDYRYLLNWCDFMIICGGNETQGIYMAQAWSMNRPTLVYEAAAVIDRGGNSAPYITESTGQKWHDFNELKEGLRVIGRCRPRTWVLEHQTNKASFANFINIIESI